MNQGSRSQSDYLLTERVANKGHEDALLLDLQMTLIIMGYLTCPFAIVASGIGSGVLSNKLVLFDDGVIKLSGGGPALQMANPRIHPLVSPMKRFSFGR